MQILLRTRDAASLEDQATVKFESCLYAGKRLDSQVEMVRALSTSIACLLLCSCGVYQTAVDTSPDHDAAWALTNPVSAIVGIHPDTTAQNFKPFSYYAGVISSRNEGEMTPVRSKEILSAMDRCFGEKDVKKMSEQKAESLFGPPDERKATSGWTILVYRIQGGKYGERWLTLD